LGKRGDNSFKKVVVKIVVFDLRQKKTLLDFNLKNPVRRNEKMGNTIKGEKSNKLPTGSYEGVVEKIEFKETPYKYTEIFVKESTKEVTLKVSIPTKITEDTALGIVLTNFGSKIEVNKDYDVEGIVKVGTKVSFEVEDDVTDRGTFARIKSETLKPKK